MNTIHYIRKFKKISVIIFALLCMIMLPLLAADHDCVDEGHCASASDVVIHGYVYVAGPDRTACSYYQHHMCAANCRYCGTRIAIDHRGEDIERHNFVFTTTLTGGYIWKCSKCNYIQD